MILLIAGEPLAFISLEPISFLYEPFTRTDYSTSGFKGFDVMYLQTFLSSMQDLPIKRSKRSISVVINASPLL